MARNPNSLFSPQARSLPHRGAFIRAMIVAGWFHYLSLLGALALGAFLLLEHRNELLPWFLGAIGLVVFTGILGYALRRSARCPLCHGTPLLDQRASRHEKALRLPPLNHGQTALLHLSLTRRFRCMFCGTPFHLGKKRG